MAHRHRSGADEALPSFAQRQAFDRPADRIGPIQHPHRLAVCRRRFEHVTQRRDERINAAAQVLQIDEDDVACLHHRIRRLAHLAIQTEHRNAVHRIFEIRRLDHVVLLVAAQTMLRAERGGDLDVTASGQRIERMRQVSGDRSGMREQRYALVVERRAQGGFGDKPIDAESHRYTLERIGGVTSCPLRVIAGPRPGLGPAIHADVLLAAKRRRSSNGYARW